MLSTGSYPLLFLGVKAPLAVFSLLCSDLSLSSIRTNRRLIVYTNNPPQVPLSSPKRHIILPHPPMLRSYEVVEGFFIAHPGNLPPRFGLKDTSYNRWRKLKRTIDRLNTSSPPGTKYKVFFVARHGEGFHNMAEAKYGTEEWDDYWSKQNGDGKLIWGPDPELTDLGKNQAKSAHDLWKKELEFDIPVPEKLYCSPLTRAIHTNAITFDSIISKPQRPMIVENLREVNGVHTCDKRRTRTYIRQAFPGFDIEEGFMEEDSLWNPLKRETHAEIETRIRRLLDMIFEKDQEQFISVTAHGGVFGALLRVTNQNKHILPVGGVMPMVIKSSLKPSG